MGMLGDRALNWWVKILLYFGGKNMKLFTKQSQPLNSKNPITPIFSVIFMLTIWKALKLWKFKSAWFIPSFLQCIPNIYPQLWRKINNNWFNLIRNLHARITSVIYLQIKILPSFNLSISHSSSNFLLTQHKGIKQIHWK